MHDTPAPSPRLNTIEKYIHSYLFTHTLTQIKMHYFTKQIFFLNRKLQVFYEKENFNNISIKLNVFFFHAI